jgi:hypothetical protein
VIRDPVAEHVRAAAFRRLLRTSEHVSATQLAETLLVITTLVTVAGVLKPGEERIS